MPQNLAQLYIAENLYRRQVNAALESLAFLVLPDRIELAANIAL